jgi:hypothetical protein
MEMIDWQEKALKKAKEVRDFVVTLLHREYTPRDLALLFLLALFAGAAVKSLVNDRLTIGFDDYKLSRSENIVDLNLLQKELIENGGTLATSEEPAPRGESCPEEGE